MKALLSAFVAACTPLACERPSPVGAYVVEDRSQLVGGPGAIGDVGDFVLENDRIRVVIAGPGNSPGPGMFGGSILDVDLRRSEPEFSGANGLDSFSEAFPMVNLAVTGYAEGVREEGIGDLAIEIVDDGASGKRAWLRVRGKGDRLVEALGTIATVGVRTNLSFETDYILDPGKPYLRIVTRIRDDDPRGPRPAEGGPTALAPLSGDERMFDVLLGDPADSEDQGFLGGDFLLFGPKVSVFAPGEGHEVQLLFQRGFENRKDVVNEAIGVPFLAASGDRVSYAYFSAEGNVLVPIFSSSFTGAFTGQCGWNACGSRPATEWLEYTRYFAVGEGDVASAVDSYWDIRSEPSGRIAGRVVDGRSGEPVSGARVVAVADPGGSRSFDEVVAANRAATGDAGIVQEMETDVGVDPIRDGDFAGRLPPGSYLVFARVPGGEPTQGLPVEVPEGGTVRRDIALPATGEVHVRVWDGAGTPIPAKVTILGPGECGGSGEASPAARSSLRRLTLGDSELPDGIASAAYVREGGGILEMAPGRYEAIVSRGIEYSIDRQCIDVRPGVDVILQATLIRVVDTTGWISGDFHVHGVWSFDADVSHRARVMSALGEGLELVSTSDHDAVADLGPTARAMGVDHLVKTMIGLETTTIETGHYLGFPLRIDDREPQGGAIEWTRRDACLLDPEAPRCGEVGGVLPLLPDEIFDGLRSIGSLGPRDTVVLVPHPRDGFFGYFDQFGLSTFDLGLEPGVFSGQNPVLAAENFSPALDAIELFNAKRFELIRTPSIAEVDDFRALSVELDETGAPPAERAARTMDLARRVLHRSPEEQRELEIGSECDEDADCGDDVCDPVRHVCTSPPPSCNAEEPGGPPSPCPGDLRCDLGVPMRCRSPDRPTTHHEGVVDDWFRLLDAGVVWTGMGNSDTHDLHSIEVGLPRNFLRSPTDSARDVEARDVVDAVLGHGVTASFGPFVEMWVDDGPIGTTVVPRGPTVTVCVRVQTPEWFGAERLELYRNGSLWREELSAEPVQEILDFDGCWEDRPERDSWYVAIAMSETSHLAPVYTSVVHPQLGLSQVAALAFSAIDDPLIEVFLSETPRAPETTAVIPYAVTNPVWVDLDGDGFDPPDPAPEWATRNARMEMRPLSRARLRNPFVRPDEMAVRRSDLLRRQAGDAFGQ